MTLRFKPSPYPVDELKKMDDSVERTRATHGRVISADIGEWSGRSVGPIILELDDGQRMELRYDSRTLGKAPAVGDVISVQYIGDQIFQIVSFEYVSKRPERTLSELPESEHDLMTGIPPAVAVMCAILTLVGTGFIIYGLVGDFPSRYAEANTLAFEALGIVHYVFSALLYMYSDR